MTEMLKKFLNFMNLTVSDQSSTSAPLWCEIRFQGGPGRRRRGLSPTPEILMFSSGLIVLRKTSAANWADVAAWI